MEPRLPLTESVVPSKGPEMYRMVGLNEATALLNSSSDGLFSTSTYSAKVIMSRRQEGWLKRLASLGAAELSPRQGTACVLCLCCSPLYCRAHPCRPGSCVLVSCSLAHHRACRSIQPARAASWAEVAPGRPTEEQLAEP